MSYSSRFWIYGPVGLLVLAVVLYSVFWRVQADMLAAELDSANGGEILPGLVFTFADKSVGGFPFRLDAVLSGVTLTDRSPAGETAWRTERLAVHALAYRRNLYVLEVAGLQSFSFPGDAGEPPRVIYVTPALARASALMQNGRIARFDLDLVDPEGKDARAPDDQNRTFSASRAQLHLLARADDSIDVAAKVENGMIGEGYRPRLGSALNMADLRGKIVGGASFPLLEGGRRRLSEALEQWRRNGGKIDVQRLALDWNGLKMDMTGSLTVDDDHRLAGELVGSLDAGALVGALTRGQFNLQASNANVPISLRFRDGDVEVGLSSGLAPPAR